MNWHKRSLGKTTLLHCACVTAGQKCQECVGRGSGIVRGNCRSYENCACRGVADTKESAFCAWGEGMSPNAFTDSITRKKN